MGNTQRYTRDQFQDMLVELKNIHNTVSSMFYALTSDDVLEAFEEAEVSEDASKRWDSSVDDLETLKGRLWEIDREVGEQLGLNDCVSYFDTHLVRSRLP